MPRPASEQNIFIQTVLAPTYFGMFDKVDYQIKQHTVYLIIHKETKQTYVGRSSIPLDRIYKHIIGNGSSSSWFINANNWKEFDIQLIPVKTKEIAQSVEKTLIALTSDNSYNCYGNKNHVHAKKHVTVNGNEYNSIYEASKELGFYPVKLYKLATKTNNITL